MGMSSFDDSSQAFKDDHEDPWSVGTDEEEEDELEDSDDEQLTLLVRKSYLTYLTRCLQKNYDEFGEHKEALGPGDVNKLVTSHAKYLEKRALRASMRVGIYQRCMVKQIDEIKKATKQNQIHPSFSERRPPSKEFTEKETQTEELQKTDMRQSYTNAFGLSPGNDDQYDEFWNILTATQMTPSHSMEMDTEIGSSVLDQSTLGETAHNMDSFVNHEEALMEIVRSPTRKMNLDERLKQLGLVFDDEEVDSVQPLPATANTQTQNMIESLQTVACTSSIVEPALKGHHWITPSDWAKELTIQTDLLQAIMDKKSPLMRAIIERRFRDLFGIDPPPEVKAPSPQPLESQPILQLDTSQDGFLESRRTVARQVVNALTPYFLRRRIGSRQVFKYLAKRITDRILCRTFMPDPTVAKKETKICFAIKPNFLSIGDVDEVFYALGSS